MTFQLEEENCQPFICIIRFYNTAKCLLIVMLRFFYIQWFAFDINSGSSSPSLLAGLCVLCRRFSEFVRVWGINWRLMVGEGGCDAAGENTPTPDSLRLVSPEKNTEGFWDDDESESGLRALLLLVSFVLCRLCNSTSESLNGDSEEELIASLIWMEGGVGIIEDPMCTVALSLVDAFTSSTTPSVLAIA